MPSYYSNHLSISLYHVQCINFIQDCSLGWDVESKFVWHHKRVSCLGKFMMSLENVYIKRIIKVKRDLLGGPVAKIPCFQCRGPRFNPWSGN